MPAESEANFDDLASPWMRGVSLGSVCVLGFVLVGFLKGITEQSRTVRATARQFSDEAAVPNAKSYSELAAASLGPNAAWTSDFSSFKFAKPTRFEPVVRTSEMKSAALADRQRTRAFDGAPPVIPHPIEQHSAASCLVCHGEGAKLGDRIATKMSHVLMTNCTQCHVEATSTGPLPQELAVDNQFAGQSRSGSGQRAYLGAPPTIPHSLFLREDCMSCHGLVARPGLRTTHPWLSNCVQCHAPPNELPVMTSGR